MSDSLRHHGLYSPWNSPGQNTGVGSLSFRQGISPTQGLNPGLPHCRQILYQLSHKGSPRVLEWVAFPFSRGSPQPRDWTRVSCAAGRFFTSWATRQVLHRVLCRCQSQSPNPPPHLLVILCSLHLCLYFYFSNKFISTIFLDPTYKYTYVFLFLTV